MKSKVVAKKILMKLLVSLSFGLIFFCFNSKTVFAETLTDINENKYELLSDGTAKLIKYNDTCTELNDYKIQLDNGDELIITIISDWAFNYINTITSVYFPDVTIIGENAFTNCANLTSVNFPKAIYINDLAFVNCANLTDVYFPNAISIGSGAFDSCKLSGEVSFPKVESVGSTAFYKCGFSDISLPNVDYIGRFAFQECSNLANVWLPKLTSTDDYIFDICSTLTSVSLPSLTYVGNKIFNGCPNNLTIYGNNTVKQYLEHNYNNVFKFEYGVTEFALNKTNLSKKVGDKDSLTYSITTTDNVKADITWNSSNSNIVAVDNNGNIEAKSEGSAIITAAVADGSEIKATCSITVTKDNPDPNPNPNPDPDPEPKPEPDPDPEPEPEPEPEPIPANATFEMNQRLFNALSYAASLDGYQVVNFEEYDGTDCLTSDVLNFLNDHPNVILVLDYTFFDEDTKKDIHCHVVINQAILSKVLKDDEKYYGAAILSSFVQYYDELPTGIKNQNY